MERFPCKFPILLSLCFCFASRSDEPGPEPVVSRTATDAPGEEVVLGLEDRADHHRQRRLAHAQALRPQGSVDAGVAGCKSNQIRYF